MKSRKKELTPDKTYFVADMHELINPQPIARKLYDAMSNRSLSDAELKAIYDHSEDPLVVAVETAIQSRRRNPNFLKHKGDKEHVLLFSLGDMVANRVNYGGGTERSIVGKLAKKARELGVPQHIYLMDHIEENKLELQEFAHRNNLWTQLRFDALDNLLGGIDGFTFAHLNGNADVFSSLIGETVLPEERSPTQVYERSTALNGYYFASQPGFLLDVHTLDFDEDFGDQSEATAYLLVPQMLDFSQSDFKNIRDGMVNFKFWFSELYRGRYDLELAECPGEFYNVAITETRLLIHEALDPKVCEKPQNVEGIDTYHLMMRVNNVSQVVHGHTHNSNLVKYDYNGCNVAQVPPNRLVNWDEISGK